MATTTTRTRGGYTSADWEDFVLTGPGTLPGQYMRLFWHPILLAKDLPAGQALPIKVMSEEFTLYRGESGTPHLVEFRCAHRGTQLSSGWIEDDCIRCRYHGWKYDASGQCVDQPMEDTSFAPKVRIKSYPVQEYLGLIFAYLGEGEPPPIPRYSSLEAEGLLEWEYYVRGCNYFNFMENDFGHGAFVHRDPRLPKGVFYPPVVTVEECPFGITAYMQYPRDLQIMLQGMPNMRYVKSAPRDPQSGAWRDTMMWKVPIDDESHMSLKAELVHLTGDAARRYQERRQAWLDRGGRVFAPELSDAILAGKARLEDLEGRPEINMANLSDDVTQIGQGRIRDRRHERLGKSDEYVILLRKIWARECRALAEGRPLTQWSLPDNLIPTPGFKQERAPSGVVYEK